VLGVQNFEQSSFLHFITAGTDRRPVSRWRVMDAGILLVHKPVGPTSFSLVQGRIDAARARRPNKRPRFCHGGTLDPFASGLLLILAGPATKLFDHLHDIPKVYEATIRWGIETDNGDPLGQPTFTGDPSSLSPQRLDELLPTLVGWHDQTPPATSAKRIGGERAYEKAHRGESVDLPPSRVYLHEATWLDHDLPNHSRLRIVVRGGYYVRALARDLGRTLGCGAHLSALHRTAIGPWTDPCPENSTVLHGRQIMPWTPSRSLTDQEVGDLRQARPIPRGELVDPEWHVPAGFPPAQPLVRGIHLDRLRFVLRPEQDALAVTTELGAGI
jgi:tRNA pseudouridine55 synthase